MPKFIVILALTLLFLYSFSQNHMFEYFIVVVLLFVFLYSKNRTDQLRDEINSLRARLDAGAKTGELGQPVPMEDPVAKVVPEAIPVAQSIKPLPIKGEKAAPAAAAGCKNVSDGGREFKLGSKVFTGVGVVAVIFAIGFFLRYAFENDLITEFGRVALGVFAGLVLLAVGEITRPRYPKYGQPLTGGGLGVLYLSFYAAFSFYGLLAQPTAFFMMILVTIAGIFLSLRQNSMGLAVFAQVGGFLTPLLLDSGSASPHVLFLYVVLLDLAVFLLAFYKLWQPLSLVSFIGTAIAFLYWYFNSYSGVYFTAAQGYLSLFFILFLAIPFIQYFVKKSPENSWDLSLVMMNPFFYFMMSYAIIDPVHHNLMGWFTITLGALYCALAASIGGQVERASNFRHFLLTAGFVLLAIAVPIQFDGKWVTVAWAVEALAYISAGFKLRFPLYRVLGNCLLFLAMMRIVFFEGDMPLGSMPVFNERFLTYVMFFAVAAAAAYIFRREKNSLGSDERQMFSILALEGAFMGLLGPSLDIRDFPEIFGSYCYPILWTAGGLAAGALSFRLRGITLRLVTYSTFTVSIFRLLFFESHIAISKTARYIPIFNTRVFAFLFSAAVVRYFLALLRRNKDKVTAGEYQFFQPALFLAFHFLMLWLVSAEIITYCDHQALIAGRGGAFDFDSIKNVLLSVAWTVYSIVLLSVGIIKKATYERFLAIALFMGVIFKVFLVDTADLGNLYRFFSFITLGCILLLTGYLYYRYQDRLRKFVKGE